MGIFDKKQQLSKNEPRKAPAPPPKPKSLFEEKKEWHRIELTRRMRKGSPYVPGGGGKMYSLQERTKMIDEVFPRNRFRDYISEIEVKRRLRELRMERYRAKTRAEKLETDRKIRYLREFTGVKSF